MIHIRWYYIGDIVTMIHIIIIYAMPKDTLSGKRLNFYHYEQKRRISVTFKGKVRPFSLFSCSVIYECNVQPSSQLSYTRHDAPSCTWDYVTFVGERFKSYEDAKNVYFDYALSVGFSVRKESTKIVEEKLVFRRFLGCKKGYPNIRSRPSTNDWEFG